MCCTIQKEDRYVVVLETLKLTGNIFHDSEFPASPESLIEEWDEHSLEFD